MRLLNEYDVMLEGILLKPNMILPGTWHAGGIAVGPRKASSLTSYHHSCCKPV